MREFERGIVHPSNLAAGRRRRLYLVTMACVGCGGAAAAGEDDNVIHAFRCVSGRAEKTTAPGLCNRAGNALSLPTIQVLMRLRIR